MSGPAFIGSTFGGANAFSVSRTPAAGNDLILQVLAFASSGDTPTITDSTGATVIADFAFSGGIGVYRVHNATGVSHTLNVSWSTAPSNWYLTLYEASNVVGVDTEAGTPALATGTSATPTTGSLDPPANGDLLFSAITINHFLSSLGSLTNGFTQTEVYIGGPAFIQAYLSQSTAASVNCGATANTSLPWSALLIAYTGVAVTVSPTALLGGSVGLAYSETISASGGTTPYTFAVTSGSLPPGLSLSSAGALTGMPTAAGTYSFTVQATDANGYAGSQPYSGVVISSAATSPPGILYVVLSDIATSSSPGHWRLTIPGISAGSQIEAAGNSTGTKAAPPGLQLCADGTYGFAGSSAPLWVRLYNPTNGWGPWMWQPVPWA